MAMSRAERPWLPSAQDSRLPPEKTTCSTGPGTASNGVGLRAAPGEETAKPVPLSTRPAPASASKVATVSAETGSLRLAQNTGSGLTPSCRSASIRASTGARLPACSSAR